MAHVKASEASVTQQPLSGRYMGIYVTQQPLTREIYGYTSKSEGLLCATEGAPLDGPRVARGATAVFLVTLTLVL